MNEKRNVCIGMVGAGRATELHMNALKRYNGVPYRCKHIVARRQEPTERAKERYGFEKASLNFDDLLEDPEIDVIDICTPPYVHEEMIIKAIKAGKHVICEKPLSGYFGNGNEAEPIGLNVPKEKMYKELLRSMERLKKVVNETDRKFMYAENFIYAPAVDKAAEIITKKKSRILFMKGEESLKGSSSHVAGYWDKTGGGTFIRTGTHPLSAILWLKQQEALMRQENIYIQSIVADMGRITPLLNDYEHRHIAARPVDVEDFGSAVITFSDGTKAQIIATDTLLGGSKNYIELYCNDAAINCRLTMSDMMETYFLDEDNMDQIYLSEMLPAKTGWNKPFLMDDIARGYVDEMRDFIECVYWDRQPKSGFRIAYETVKVIYAAYMAAGLGRRIEFDEQGKWININI